MGDRIKRRDLSFPAGALVVGAFALTLCILWFGSEIWGLGGWIWSAATHTPSSSAGVSTSWLWTLWVTFVVAVSTSLGIFAFSRRAAKLQVNKSGLSFIISFLCVCLGADARSALV